jgi:glycosyltransferase involved in cell wall biosynthesis
MIQEPYTVSILVPVYGVEKYIERCARSIFEQTYHDLDIVFVDDCTPDKSIEILKRVLEEYSDRKAQTRIIRHEHNRGLAAARNTAVAAAVGTFLIHVDSDDWIENDAVEELVKKQEETGADFVTGVMVKNEDTLDYHYVEPVYKDKNDMMILILSQIFHHELANRLVKRALYTDHHIKALEGVNQAEDWRLTPMLLWYANGIARLNKTTYHYFMNMESMCNSKKSMDKALKFYHDTYTNYSSLMTFFEDKSQLYHDIVLNVSCSNCYSFMVEMYKYHSQMAFYKYRHELLCRYGSVLRQRLGSKINFILRLPLSYFVLRAYLRIGKRFMAS